MPRHCISYDFGRISEDTVGNGTVIFALRIFVKCEFDQVLDCKFFPSDRVFLMFLQIRDYVQQVEDYTSASTDRVSERGETERAAVEGKTLEFRFGLIFLAAPFFTVLSDADEEAVLGMAVLVPAHIV
jgi:hypothetical protein